MSDNSATASASKQAGAGKAMTLAVPRILNVNVGVLGHVDSGKTSLVAALSTKLSTAALDKHPQSKERGITLDLGFSSFTMQLPEHLQHLPYDELQFTLVDCPGHASLIRTIIGGVQIIDMMVLVVDINKGLQTQTAECLVVGEIATNSMVVVLNKCDLIPEAERAKAVRKAQKRLAQTFNLTKFAGVPMIPVIAKPGGGGTGTTAEVEAQGLDQLKAFLMAMVVPPPPPEGPSKGFLFAVDHCFPIKGQGTVLTGTVLQGAVAVGETVELPALKITKPVKSMQMFKRPVNKAVKGDRLGICVTQLDASLVERGLLCTPGSVPTFTGAVAAVEKIRFFGGPVQSKAKFHISVGHATVMATLTFFGLPDGQGVAQDVALALMIENLGRMSMSDTTISFDKSKDYVYQEQLHGLEGRPVVDPQSLPSHLQPSELSEEDAAGGVGASGSWEAHGAPDGPRHFGSQWAVLVFDQPVTAPADALVIGARLDADVHGESCRLAFYGRVLSLITPSKPADMQQLRLYKVKEKRGVIERINEEQGYAIVRGMFKKETDPAIYINLKVLTGKGEEGIIEGPFGKSGKLKVSFAAGIQQAGRASSDNAVVLRCKRYIYEKDRKRLRQ